MPEHGGESMPPTLSRERTPVRMRRTRKVVTSGITWLPPEQVPGAVLSAETERRLAEHSAAWRAHHARARRHGYIWDLWGRLHHVAAVRSVHPWVVSAALRETGNFPYQGLNSGALKLSQAAIMDDLVEAGAYGDVWYPLLPVHDEIVSEVRIDYAQEVAELMKFRFEECVPLAVPVKAEFKTGKDVLTWGKAK